MPARRINALIDALIIGEEGTMSRRVDTHEVRTPFEQLMDRAVRNKERFAVDRRGDRSRPGERILIAICKAGV
jgi:hypothetical protein